MSTVLMLNTLGVTALMILGIAAWEYYWKHWVEVTDEQAEEDRLFRRM